MTESVVKAIGEGDGVKKRLTSEQQRAILQAFRKGGHGVLNTSMAREIGDISKLSDQEALKKIDAQLKKM